MQLDDMRMLEGRKNGELLFDTTKAIDDGAPSDASIAREDGPCVCINRFLLSVVWVIVLVTPLLGECLECHVNFLFTLYQWIVR